MQISSKLLFSAIFLLIQCLIFGRTEVLFSESVDGSVTAGNYTFYSYSGDYKIKLVLTSHSGDADLYVSQTDRIPKPTFDLAEHDLQSVTCGQEVIHIPEDFRRPIGIAVYGHPSHETSDFTLDVIGVDYFDDNDPSVDNSLTYINEEELQFYEEFFGEPYTGLNNVPKKTKKKEFAKEIYDNEKSGWNLFLDGLFFILEIVGEILIGLA